MTGQSIGRQNNHDNQMEAFYYDLTRYVDSYASPETNGNIPVEMSIGEYVATKHHDGINYSDFEEALCRKEYNKKIDGRQPEEIVVGAGWPYLGSPSKRQHSWLH